MSEKSTQLAQTDTPSCLIEFFSRCEQEGAREAYEWLQANCPRNSLDESESIQISQKLIDSEDLCNI